jgi:hypothetical protein
VIGRWLRHLVWLVFSDRSLVDDLSRRDGWLSLITGSSSGGHGR